MEYDQRDFNPKRFKNESVERFLFENEGGLLQTLNALDELNELQAQKNSNPCHYEYHNCWYNVIDEIKDAGQSLIFEYWDRKERAGLPLEMNEPQEERENLNKLFKENPIIIYPFYHKPKYIKKNRHQAIEYLNRSLEGKNPKKIFSPLIYGFYKGRLHFTYVLDGERIGIFKGYGFTSRQFNWIKHKLGLMAKIFIDRINECFSYRYRKLELSHFLKDKYGSFEGYQNQKYIAYQERRAIAKESHPFILYSKRTRKLTELQPQHKLSNWKKQGKGKGQGYAADHCVSITWGYRYGVPEEVIADLRNQVMMPGRKNSSKHGTVLLRNEYTEQIFMRYRSTPERRVDYDHWLWVCDNA